MINAMFIVWRECFEAVLIVGIVFSFLSRQPDARRALRYMWGGVAASLVLSALLAFGLHTASTELEGLAMEYFQVAILVIAALLMTHMCVWMKHKARTIKAGLEGDLRGALGQAKLLGVAGLTAVAIAREGFELVMFFYGMGIEAAGAGQMRQLLAYSMAGVALTAVTAWALQKGLALFKQKLFFQVTTAFLLVTAASLMLVATRRLIQMDVLPTLQDQIWDTSAFLDERSAIGQVVSTLTGYESTPALITVLVYVAYWLVAGYFFFGKPVAARAPSQLAAA